MPVAMATDGRHTRMKQWEVCRMKKKEKSSTNRENRVRRERERERERVVEETLPA